MNANTHANIRTISVLIIAICMIIFVIWGLNAI